MGFEKHLVSCTHHYSDIQNKFLQIPSASSIQPSFFLLKSLATTNHPFTTSIKGRAFPAFCGSSNASEIVYSPWLGARGIRVLSVADQRSGAWTLADLWLPDASASASSLIAGPPPPSPQS